MALIIHPRTAPPLWKQTGSRGAFRFGRSV